MYPLRYKRLWLCLGALLVGTVCVLSLIPSPPELHVSEGDKFAHGAAYLVQMCWFGALYERPRHLGIGLYLVLLGVALEILQGIGGYRTFDVLDMAANGLGVVIGLVLLQTPVGLVMQRADAALAYVCGAPPIG